MTMKKEIETFCESVTKFCNWAEGATHGLVEARQLLLLLMQGIPEVEAFAGDYDGDEEEFDRRGNDAWEEDHSRFADLPFQFYKLVFNPHDLEEDESVGGDLADDLADIYEDLSEGMQAFQKGLIKDAVTIWVDSYFYNWGHHAASALRAIDEFYRENRESEQDTSAAAD